MIYQVSSALYMQGLSTLSTTTTTESDRDFTNHQGYYEGVGSVLRISYANESKGKYLTLSSKTTYYLNHMMNTDGNTPVIKEATLGNMLIRAVCAYL